MDQEINKKQYKPGRWSKQEHMEFLIALSEHGKDWKLIQQKVPSRSVIQIRSHAQKYFKRSKDSNKLYSIIQSLFKDYFTFLNTVKSSHHPCFVFTYCQEQYKRHKNSVSCNHYQEPNKFIRIE